MTDDNGPPYGETTADGVIWDRELDEAKASPGRIIVPIVCAVCWKSIGSVHDSPHGALLLATRREPSMKEEFFDPIKELAPDQPATYPSVGIAELLDRPRWNRVTLRCRRHRERTVDLSELAQAVLRYRELGKVEAFAA